MSSGVALATARTEQQNPTRGNTNNGECYWASTHHITSKSRYSDGFKSQKSLKRRPPAPISTPAFKKNRSCVQRTHSPKTVPSPTSVRNTKVQKVTPTVNGIKEVAQHLLKSRNVQTRQSFVALPTECTYEMCSVLPWSKKESLSEVDSAYREKMLRSRKLRLLLLQTLQTCCLLVFCLTSNSLCVFFFSQIGILLLHCTCISTTS